MQRHRNRRLPAFVAMALLSGCAGATSDGRRAAPPLVDYPPAFQARGAEELDALGPACPLQAADDRCSTLARMIEDYGELRARMRAGRGT